MDIQIEKYRNDWSKEVSDTEKLLIKAGLKDIEEGHTFPHDHVIAEIFSAYRI